MPKITILHDGTLDLAVGKSRNETSWKNQQITWSAFTQRLSATHRTAETHAEYIGAKKGRQDEIKDIGGYVGGIISGGRRLKRSILTRQLVTLDIDFGNSGFWDDFTMMYSNAACVYSTHKHSAASPRLRLIMPLDRPVQPDEYQAIARKIAGTLDIELFDPTTFQPERLMYWPSTSKDGLYEYKVQDGSWLCADEILASYVDWRDSSDWPVSEKASKSVLRNIAKQGDPLEKTGVVGAFCRTYSITDVIETYLSDVYDACDVEGRYTYKEGSTAGGLVVYDDKFTYSHHGTDPTSLTLCNAFDLVRMHLYGLRDEDAKEGTPSNKLPSYLAMLDLCRNDSKVRNLLVTERTEEARRDFGLLLLEAGEVEGSLLPSTELVEPEAEEVDGWQEKLECDRKGNIQGTINNILTILENDKYFKGRLAFDDFEKCEVAVKDLPWRKISRATRRLIDRDDANIRHYLEKAYGISHVSKTVDAMAVWAQKTSFHPVKDYLNGLTWDGVPRLDSLLIDYQGAEDNLYTRTVTRKTFVAAVARIFQPGIKFDTILTMIGEQGLKKSTLIKLMGREWYSESFSFNDLKNNQTRALEQIQGAWIIEIPEMSGMAKAEIEIIKHFVSKTEDRFRVAYGRRTENFARQGIFIGSTNSYDFLKDPTGNRRFWPVAVYVNEPTKQISEQLNSEEVGQIWAEAVRLYKTGETLYLDKTVEKLAKQVQADHTEQHPWTSIVLEYLDTKLPKDWYEMDRYDRFLWLQDQKRIEEEGVQYRGKVCILEIWYEALGKRDLIDVRSANTIRNILTMAKGWKEIQKVVKIRSYGSQRKSYERIETPYLTIKKELNFNKN